MLNRCTQSNSAAGEPVAGLQQNPLAQGSRKLFPGEFRLAHTFEIDFVVSSDVCYSSISGEHKIQSENQKGPDLLQAFGPLVGLLPTPASTSRRTGARLVARVRISNPNFRRLAPARLRMFPCFRQARPCSRLVSPGEQLQGPGADLWRDLSCLHQLKYGEVQVSRKEVYAARKEASA